MKTIVIVIQEEIDVHRMLLLNKTTLYAEDKLPRSIDSRITLESIDKSSFTVHSSVKLNHVRLDTIALLFKNNEVPQV